MEFFLYKYVYYFSIFSMKLPCSSYSMSIDALLCFFSDFMYLNTFFRTINSTLAMIFKILCSIIIGVNSRFTLCCPSTFNPLKFLFSRFVANVPSAYDERLFLIFSPLSHKKSEITCVFV